MVTLMVHVNEAWYVSRNRDLQKEVTAKERFYSVKSSINCFFIQVHFYLCMFSLTPRHIHLHTHLPSIGFTICSFSGKRNAKPEYPDSRPADNSDNMDALPVDMIESGEGHSAGGDESRSSLKTLE